MKSILFLTLFLNFAHADGFKARTGESCQKKVEALIHKTALEMGAPKKFGLNFTVESAGQDTQSRPLSIYKAGVFIIDEGYLSNSYADVTVRNPDHECAILKLEVAVGG